MNNKKCYLLLLFSIVVICFMNVNVYAKTNKLEYNKWYTAKYEKAYQINLKNNTPVIIEIKNTNKGDYLSINNNKYDDYFHPGKSYYFILKKGKNTISSFEKITFRIINLSKKCKDFANYSFKTAKEIKKNEKVYICSSECNKYSKMYKYNLKNNGKINIQLMGNYPDINIYDSNFDPVNTYCADNKVGTKKLFKGTYYILVNDYISKYDNFFVFKIK